MRRSRHRVSRRASTRVSALGRPTPRVQSGNSSSASPTTTAAAFLRRPVRRYTVGALSVGCDSWRTTRSTERASSCGGAPAVRVRLFSIRGKRCERWIPGHGGRGRWYLWSRRAHGSRSYTGGFLGADSENDRYPFPKNFGVYESAVAGTPQGGVISPLLSNIYLHVFDEWMERAGFQLTRYADDWLIVCRTRAEAERALASACAVLEGELGLRVHPEKTRIVHVSQGFEFLGYKIGLGRGLRFKQGGSGLYAIPRQRSVDRFKDKVRALTRRRIAVPLEELIRDLNLVIRGWGMYYRRANVRRLFNRLNMWIVRRIWGWRFKRWRNAGWRTLPETRLYGEYGLVNLLQLIPSMREYYRQKGYTH